MPHFPKPFFKASRGRWYLQVGPKQYNLGPDKDQAFERYHEIMRGRPKEADCSLAVGVLDAFLTWVQQNRPARTYEWYRRHCQVFARSIPPLLSVGQLKKHHLTACLARLSWRPSTKNGLCRAVCRAFQWAEDEELIVRSPLRRFKKPKAGRREVLVAPEEFTRMLSCFEAECIRDLLTIAWETGARPQEIVAVEARHVDLESGRWVFPIDESKGQRFPRIVYLNDAALALTRKLLLRHPAGPLFRNTAGEPWNRHSVACVFGRIQLALGRQVLRERGLTVPMPPRFQCSAFPDKAALAAARTEQGRKLYERRKELDKLARKHGPKYSLYHLRHGWATRALRSGLDALTVSILLGHADPSTLARVYQHLAHDPDFLRGAVNRATGPGA